MQLTVFANDGDQSYYLEVDASMHLEDLLALISAESSETPEQIKLFFNGQQLTDLKKDLSSYGLTGKEEMVQMTSSKGQPSTSSANPQATGSAANAVNDMERWRLMLLGNPQMMEQMRRENPEMARTIESDPGQFASLMQNTLANTGGLGGMGNSREREKQRQIEILNSDPYNIEAQRKIEEMIRQEAVIENMEHAMEYSPESFGNVHMLYIDVEVNGHKVKAFVDSGAQSTIISPECAEQCGLMRLLDTRFSGMARGVGTAKILGRIHSAQIRLGDLHLPVSFSVLEGRDVDLLFGLDMLKRHQACIDLEKNVLRIQGREVRFLAEHELPNKARQVEELAEEIDQASATGNLPLAPQAPAAGSTFSGAGQKLGGASASTSTPGAPSTMAPSSSSQYPESSIEAIMNLGVSREQAISTLDAAGGNVDVAASLLF